MNTNTPAALAETIARRLQEAAEKARAFAAWVEYADALDAANELDDLDAELLLREFRLLTDAAEEFRRRVREELSRRGRDRN